MNGQGLSWWRGMLVIALVISAVGCRKPSETVKSDLKQAGFELTADDWFRASRGNEVSVLKKFVSSGFATDTRDANGDTALHAAASAGAEQSADFLLDHGLAVDVLGANGRTPLMAAAIAGESQMVAWLLRQGASPALKDKDGTTPLMLAVRAGKAGTVEELAPFSRNQLDEAILMAALEGQARSIDALTNYGASVYATMEDGRNPLMLAAQNGHAEAVKLLLEIGSSRLATDEAGRTAADLAIEAVHPEIASLLSRDPLPGEIALDTPDVVAESMDKAVSTNAETAAADGATPTTTTGSKEPAKAIDGAVVSKPGGQADPTSSESNTAFPPLVMRHYRERVLPIQVASVDGEAATLRILGEKPRDVQVRVGETIPNTKLVVMRMHRRMEDSKVSQGQTVEISVVEVRDESTGATREWIAGLPCSAHGPAALLEDSATGRRYTAVPGQRFQSEDGGQFQVSEVRPNQIVIKNLSTGAVSTLPLRGARG